MSEIIEIKDLQNDLCKISGICNKNSVNLKKNLTSAIQITVKEFQKANRLYNKIKYFKCLYKMKFCKTKIINKDFLANLYLINLMLIRYMNEIQLIRYKAKQKLVRIIRLILKSNYLKCIFDVKKDISDLEINMLINDIIENIIILEFKKDTEITNFIFAYMRKFLGNE